MNNSSNSFIPILSKLHSCFGHGLKICMWFGYNPQIISQVDQSPLPFSDIIYNKVNGKGMLRARNLSYSFILILLKLHRSFGEGSEYMHVVWI